MVKFLEKREILNEIRRAGEMLKKKRESPAKSGRLGTCGRGGGVLGVAWGCREVGVVVAGSLISLCSNMV